MSRSLRNTNPSRKKFVRYKDGAEIYSMCQSKFERMAREAKATYKLDKLVLVNTEIFEKYLETFWVVEGGHYYGGNVFYNSWL